MNKPTGSSPENAQLHPQSRGWERHIQTVALGLIAVLITWAGRSLETLMIKSDSWDFRITNVEIGQSALSNQLAKIRDGSQNLESRESSTEFINTQQQVLIDHNSVEVARIEDHLKMPRLDTIRAKVERMPSR